MCVHMYMCAYETVHVFQVQNVHVTCTCYCNHVHAIPLFLHADIF